MSRPCDCPGCMDDLRTAAATGSVIGAGTVTVSNQNLGPNLESHSDDNDMNLNRGAGNEAMLEDIEFDSAGNFVQQQDSGASSAKKEQSARSQKSQQKSQLQAPQLQLI